MSDDQTIQAVPDVAAVEVQGLSRGSFILRGALAAGSVYGLASVTPFVKKAMAQGSMGDVDIVNFALTLEYLEEAFYRGAPKNLSASVAPLVKRFGDDESAHAEALADAVKQLGGTPAPRPRFVFPAGNEKAFLKLAQTLEDTGVSAYNGAAPAIQSKEVLAAAGSIAQIEARHAAAIRIHNGAPPAPDAFDKPLGKAAVLKAVKPFIKS